jgi:predicted nucleic acid-binding protein
MKVAYVDTSVLVAVAFGEPESEEIARELEGFDRLLTSNLTEAEFRSALVREGVENAGVELLKGLSWILPNRPLTPEIDRVIATGYVRGADLWHLACALFVSSQPGEMSFVSLDAKQTEVAQLLGFSH